MKRIKMLGPVVASMLTAVGLIAAPAASAAGFVADSESATVSGNSTQATFVMGSGTTAVFCDLDVGTDALSGPEKTIAPTISDSECVGNASLEPNGCRFVLDPQGAGENGTFGIGPAGCGPMVLHYGACELEIGPQNGFDATFSAEASGSEAVVVVDLDGSGLEFSGCKSTYKTLSFEGEWTLSAENAGGGPTGLHTAASSLFLSGETPVFDSEWTSNWDGNPFPVFGAQDAPNALGLDLGIRTASCAAVDFSDEFSAATSHLSLAATQTGCVASPGNLPTTIDMNSCSYALDVVEAGSPYSGEMSVECGKEGDAIEVSIYSSQAKYEEGKSACVIDVPTQTASGGVNLENVGSGIELMVAAEFDAEGIEYTVSGSPLLCGTSKSNGTYIGSATLAGL